MDEWMDMDMDMDMDIDMDMDMEMEAEMEMEMEMEMGMEMEMKADNVHHHHNPSREQVEIGIKCKVLGCGRHGVGRRSAGAKRDEVHAMGQKMHGKRVDGWIEMEADNVDTPITIHPWDSGRLQCKLIRWYGWTRK